MTETGSSLLLAAALLLTFGDAGAASQKVFRCGPDGRVFSQTPCKDGYEVNADDKRSAEQRKAADDNAKREEKMVEKMTREREAREAAGAKQGASIIRDSSLAKPVAPAASAVAAKKKRSVRKPA